MSTKSKVLLVVNITVNKTSINEFQKKLSVNVFCIKAMQKSPQLSGPVWYYMCWVFEKWTWYWNVCEKNCHYTGVICFTSLPCFAQSSLVLEQGHQEHVCSTEGHFHSSVGHICCSDGHLYSSMGHFHSSVEHICSPEGHFHSSVGHICCSMGHLYSSEGHVYSSMGHFHSSMGHFLGSYGYCLLVSCSMWEADRHKRPHHHKDVWIPLRLVDDRSSRLRWRHTGTVCSLISRKPKLLHGTHRT